MQNNVWVNKKENNGHKNLNTDDYSWAFETLLYRSTNKNAN